MNQLKDEFYRQNYLIISVPIITWLQISNILTIQVCFCNAAVWSRNPLNLMLNITSVWTVILLPVVVHTEVHFNSKTSCIFNGCGSLNWSEFKKKDFAPLVRGVEVSFNVKNMRSWRQFDSSFTLNTDRSDCLTEDSCINLFNGADSVPFDVCTTINLLMLNVDCSSFVQCWKITCFHSDTPSDQSKELLLAWSRAGIVWMWFHHPSECRISSPFWCGKKKKSVPLTEMISPGCSVTLFPSPSFFFFYSTWYYSPYLSQAVWLTEVTRDM